MRARTGRMVLNHQRECESEWAAISLIAAKVDCTPEMLHKWIRQGQKDRGKRAGTTTVELECLKELERENRGELRQVNETLRKASAYFA